MFPDRTVTYVPGLYPMLANVRWSSRAGYGSSLRSHLFLIRSQLNLGVIRQHHTLPIRSDEALASIRPLRILGAGFRL